MRPSAATKPSPRRAGSPRSRLSRPPAARCPACWCRCCASTAPPGDGSTGPMSRGYATVSRSSTKPRGGSSNHLDVPPGVGPMLGDPTIPLWITEGVKKADCGALHGLCVVALPGVWNCPRTNTVGGKMALPDWRTSRSTAAASSSRFDGDVARKDVGAESRCTASPPTWRIKGAHIEYLWLPDTPDKTGLDDYLMDGHTVADLWRLVKPTQPPGHATAAAASSTAAPKPPPAQPMSIEDARNVFHRWLGKDYDTDALDADARRRRGRKVRRRLRPCLAAHHLRVRRRQNRDRAGTRRRRRRRHQLDQRRGRAAVRDTPKRDRAANATGGLLRKIGDRGLLVIKDVTSILSMNKDVRGKVLVRAARNLRRPLVPRSRSRRRTHPRMAGPPRRHRRRHHRLGHRARRHRRRWATGSSCSASTPPRPACESRPPGHRQHRRRDDDARRAGRRGRPVSSPA